MGPPTEDAFRGLCLRDSCVSVISHLRSGLTTIAVKDFYIVISSKLKCSLDHAKPFIFTAQ